MATLALDEGGHAREAVTCPGPSAAGTRLPFPAPAFSSRFSKLEASRDFPGGPVLRTLHFHCRGHGFDPWSGN